MGGRYGKVGEGRRWRAGSGERADRAIAADPRKGGFCRLAL